MQKKVTWDFQPPPPFQNTEHLVQLMVFMSPKAVLCCTQVVFCKGSNGLEENDLNPIVLLNLLLVVQWILISVLVVNRKHAQTRCIHSIWGTAEIDLLRCCSWTDSRSRRRSDRCVICCGLTLSRTLATRRTRNTSVTTVSVAAHTSTGTVNLQWQNADSHEPST